MNNEEKAEILKSTEKLWNERNRLKELEKEIADLKKQDKICEEIIIGEQMEIDRLNEENKELKAQVEKMKNCENCRYNCKENGEEYCDSPNGVCKRYSTTFDKDNWELAE